MLFVVSFLAGCSLPQLFKSDDPKNPPGTTLRHDPRTGKLTQAGLQAEVMSFADEYVLTIRQAMDEMNRAGLAPSQRAILNRSKVLLSATAMSIAAGRNPAANLLDMVVFLTLERQVLEDYWIPKFYGDKARVLLKAVSRLEKEIWAMAGELLPPEQQENLRAMIREWRAAHPEQHLLGNVRLHTLAGLRGESPWGGSGKPTAFWPRWRMPWSRWTKPSCWRNGPCFMWSGCPAL